MAQKSAAISLPTTIPILDGKNWSRWCIQLKVILGYQDVLEIVEEGFPELGAAATAAERSTFKENKKKDCKAMYILHQCVDEAHFEKIASAKTAHEAWQLLETANEGAAKVKKVKLQTMRRQYELMAMEDSETILVFFNRVITLTNAMKAYGEDMKTLTIVEKILRCLAPRFDHVVVAMEESGKVEDMTIAALQGSLEAQEQRLLERVTERASDQAMQAQTSRKGGSQGKGNSHGKGKGKDFKNTSSKGSGNHEGSKSDQDHGESSQKKGGGNQKYRGKKKVVDRKKLRCYNCNKIGHFSSECGAHIKEIIVMDMVMKQICLRMMVILMKIHQC